MQHRDTILFNHLIITDDHEYGPTMPSHPRARLFDLYQPTGGENMPKPLMIWLHGGGFKFGSNVQGDRETRAAKGKPVQSLEPKDYGCTQVSVCDQSESVTHYPVSFSLPGLRESSGTIRTKVADIGVFLRLGKFNNDLSYSSRRPRSHTA